MGSGRMLERAGTPPNGSTAFTIVGVCTGDFSTWSTFLSRMRAYARTHNYTLALFTKRLYAERPAAYSKLPALAQVLNTSTDWVWWVDCDTLVLSLQTPLTHVLAAALQSAGPPSPSMLMSYEVWGRTKAPAHAPGDFHPLNTGSFFLRNDAWAHAFVRNWDAACASRPFWMLWDQDAIIDMPGFRPPPLRLRGPWRLADGRAVALPNAAFNTQLCPSSLHPRHSALHLLHIVRGRGSLGRCSPDWSPGIANDKFKRFIMQAVLEHGLPMVRFVCCHKFNLAMASRGTLVESQQVLWRRIYASTASSNGHGGERERERVKRWYAHTLRNYSLYVWRQQQVRLRRATKAKLPHRQGRIAGMQGAIHGKY